MKKNPLETIKHLDSTLFSSIMDTRSKAFEEGVLPLKQKLIIALALDASEGTVEGVRSLANQIIKAGGTKDEIMETLRIVHYICGAGKMYPAAIALEDMEW